MIKNLIPFALIGLMALSGCNQGNDTAETPKNDTTLLTVLTFEQQADSCIEEPVIIEGTVLHICKHGGKRMFLVDGTDSIRVEITTGAKIAKFDDSLMGSRLRVIGILKEERIDNKYLNEWEAEVLNPTENHEVGVHTGAVGHEDQGQQDKLDQIKAYRDQLKETGKDHISFFSVEADHFIDIR